MAELSVEQVVVRFYMDRNEDGRLIRGDAARRRLLDIATASFGAYGFEGTSLRDMAQEAGVSFQLISYHFGTKDDLWNAVFEEQLSRHLAYLKSFRPEIGADKKTIRQWVNSAVSEAFADPMLRRIFTHECLENTERFQRVLMPKLTELVEESLAAFERLRLAGAAGRYSAPEFSLLMHALLGMVSAGFLIPDVIFIERVAQRKWIETVTELIMDLMADGT